MPTFLVSGGVGIFIVSAIMKLIKLKDEDKKLKRFYPMIVMAASVFSALVLAAGGVINLSVGEIAYNSGIIFCAETLGYSTLFDKSNKS